MGPVQQRGDASAAKYVTRCVRSASALALARHRPRRGICSRCRKEWERGRHAWRRRPGLALPARAARAAREVDGCPRPPRHGTRHAHRQPALSNPSRGRLEFRSNLSLKTRKKIVIFFSIIIIFVSIYLFLFYKKLRLVASCGLQCARKF